MSKIPFHQQIGPFKELLNIATSKDTPSQFSAETEEHKVLFIKKLLENTKKSIFLYISDNNTKELFENNSLFEYIEQITNDEKIDLQIVSKDEIDINHLNIVIKELVYDVKKITESFIVFDGKSYMYRIGDSIKKGSKENSKNIFAFNDPEISQELIDM